MPLTGKFNISKFKSGVAAAIASALNQMRYKKGQRIEHPDMPDLEYTMGEGETVESVLEELHSDYYFELNSGRRRDFENAIAPLRNQNSLKGEKLMIPYYMLHYAVFHYHESVQKNPGLRTVLQTCEDTHKNAIKKIEKHNEDAL